MLRAMPEHRPPNVLGQHLRELRRQMGMSQSVLAEELERILAPAETVTQSAVSQWELGDAFPSPGKLKAYAIVTGADLDWLLRLRAGVAEDERETGARPDPVPAALRSRLSQLPPDARERALAKLEGYIDAELDR